MFGNHGAGGNGVLINQFLLKKKKGKAPICCACHFLAPHTPAKADFKLLMLNSKLAFLNLQQLNQAGGLQQPLKGRRR